jgi:uncharacterized membrane protein YeaQ/YmgE (transglycosylase-associated protein family)
MLVCNPSLIGYFRSGRLFDSLDAMTRARTYSILLRAFVGALAGLLLGILLISFERTFPQLIAVLGSPSFWIFKQWQDFGLPPRGEAALAGPLFAFFIQWIVLGLIVGATSSCRRRGGNLT